MSIHQQFLLGYYGDDFTGSTDVMEVLELAGVSTILFLTPPTETDLAVYPDCRAFGIAGVSRSLNPEAMERELRPAFHALASVSCPLVHYKVCSTFDSSPRIGSIGCAMDFGREVFGEAWIPMVVGAPRLRRYVAFANLFAAAAEDIHRIDRHSTMSRHPSTPMGEADLRLHLAEQTRIPVHSFDLRALSENREFRHSRLLWMTAEGNPAILFDTVTENDLAPIGELIWENRTKDHQFVVGSSGVEYALCAWWRKSGMLPPVPTRPTVGKQSQMLVISGSASPATSTQIAAAKAVGYHLLALPTEFLIDPKRAQQAIAEVAQEAVEALRSGHNTLLYSASGPDDPVLEKTREKARLLGSSVSNLGEQQGVLLRRILEEYPLQRVCVAGGDTSGYVARALGIRALSMLTPIAPGSPLCRVHAPDTPFAGLEICLKGGQVGGPHFFEQVRLGIDHPPA